jgi:hypothetical protein
MPWIMRDAMNKEPSVGVSAPANQIVPGKIMSGWKAINHALKPHHKLTNHANLESHVKLGSHVIQEM